MSYNSTTGVCTETFEVGQLGASSAYVYSVELANNADNVNNYSYFYDGTAYVNREYRETKDFNWDGYRFD